MQGLTNKLLGFKYGVVLAVKKSTQNKDEVMTDSSLALETAEKYLKEMLEADDTANFELYINRYEEKYLANFSKKDFLDDIKSMHERNGMSTGYEFLSSLRNSKFDGLDIFRFVWKGIYEKRDAVIEMGLYKKNGNWYVIKSAVY